MSTLVAETQPRMSPQAQAPRPVQPRPEPLPSPDPLKFITNGNRDANAGNAGQIQIPEWVPIIGGPNLTLEQNARFCDPRGLTSETKHGIVLNHCPPRDQITVGERDKCFTTRAMQGGPPLYRPDPERSGSTPWGYSRQAEGFVCAPGYLRARKTPNSAYETWSVENWKLYRQQKQYDTDFDPRSREQIQREREGATDCGSFSTIIVDGRVVCADNPDGK